jgi:hypothetical protein
MEQVCSSISTLQATDLTNPTCIGAVNLCKRMPVIRSNLSTATLTTITYWFMPRRSAKRTVSLNSSLAIWFKPNAARLSDCESIAKRVISQMLSLAGGDTVPNS